ncbi:hypothetical protein Tco_0126673 [Tanacetum coccineum]
MKYIKEGRISDGTSKMLLTRGLRVQFNKVQYVLESLMTFQLKKRKNYNGKVSVKNAKNDPWHSSVGQPQVHQSPTQSSKSPQSSTRTDPSDNFQIETQEVLQQKLD